MAYIFAYGAFNTEKEKNAFNFLYDFIENDIFVCKLENHKLIWNSAFYNQKANKKEISYRDSYTKKDYKGAIVQLNLKVSIGDEIIGVIYKSNNYRFKDLDKQNSNYQRIEVTDFLNIDLPDNEKVFTYVSKEKNKEIFEEELKKNNLVISSTYYDSLISEFNNLHDKKEFWLNNNYENLKTQIQKIYLDDKIKLRQLEKKENKLHI